MSCLPALLFSFAAFTIIHFDYADFRLYFLRHLCHAARAKIARDGAMI